MNPTPLITIVLFAATSLVAQEPALPAPPVTEPSTQRTLEWAQGWSIRRLVIPAKSDLKDAYVDLQSPAARVVTLTAGYSAKEGITLEKVEWFGSPVRAKVTLRKDQEHAEFFAEAASVSQSDDLARRVPQVEIEAKFVEVPDAVADSLKFPIRESFMDKFPGTPSPSPNPRGLNLRAVLNEQDAEQMLGALNAQKGVDLLSAPRVTSRLQQRAVIEIIREFRYPSAWNPPDQTHEHWTPKSFETRNVGITLEVVPTMTDGDIVDLKATPEVVEFLGFVDFETKEPLFTAKADPAKTALDRTFDSVLGFASKRRAKPIFSTRKSVFEVSVHSGQTVVLVGSGETEETKPFEPPSAGRQLVVLIRVAARDREEAPAPAKQESKPPPAGNLPPASGIPAATAVEGKPGFVTSPHAPQAGYIDVRGFPAGVEVKCPYSGKRFLVPWTAGNR